MESNPPLHIVLKGIHCVKARLATGETRLYFYAWRGGPRIDAVPGTPEFIRQYHEAYASQRKPKSGTLMTLIAEFKASPEFHRLSPSSVRSYLFYIKLIEDEFGDLPLAALADRRVRGEFKNWRDRLTLPCQRESSALTSSIAQEPTRILPRPSISSPNR